MSHMRAQSVSFLSLRPRADAQNAMVVLLNDEGFRNDF